MTGGTELEPKFFSRVKFRADKFETLLTNLRRQTLSATLPTAGPEKYNSLLYIHTHTHTNTHRYRFDETLGHMIYQ